MDVLRRFLAVFLFLPLCIFGMCALFVYFVAYVLLACVYYVATGREPDDRWDRVADILLGLPFYLFGDDV